MDHKLAVIGNESSVLLFQAVGVESFAVSSLDEAIETLDRLTKTYVNEETKLALYAVVFVEETYYKELPKDMTDKLAKLALPAVVPVPSPSSKEEKKSFAVRRLSEIVERAVGSDIFS